MTDKKSEKEEIIQQKKEAIRAKVRKILERDVQLEEDRINRERKRAAHFITEEVVRPATAAKSISDVFREEDEQGKTPVRLDKKTIVFETKKK